MELVLAFLTYAGKFVAMAAIAVGGFLLGRRVKQSKTAKNK